MLARLKKRGSRRRAFSQPLPASPQGTRLRLQPIRASLPKNSLNTKPLLAMKFAAASSITRMATVSLFPRSLSPTSTATSSFRATQIEDAMHGDTVIAKITRLSGHDRRPTRRRPHRPHRWPRTSFRRRTIPLHLPRLRGSSLRPSRSARNRAISPAKNSLHPFANSSSPAQSFRSSRQTSSAHSQTRWRRRQCRTHSLSSRGRRSFRPSRSKSWAVPAISALTPKSSFASIIFRTLFPPKF